MINRNNDAGADGRDSPLRGYGKAAVPRADDVNELQPRQDKNFVKNNVKKAVYEMQPPKEQIDAPTIAGANKNYGKVPNYLNKYKNQREEELKQKVIE